MDLSFWISCIAIAFVAIRFWVVWLNYWWDPRLPADHSTPTPETVSVLIPARNEAANIGPTLRQLTDTGATLLEIIVLDDHSEDQTAAEVLLAATADPRIRLLQGQELPAGWLGKNWACHQLAAVAQGRVLLFMDADVQLMPGAVEAALARLRQDRLSLLSVFPDQILHTRGEQVVVPIMHWVLLTLLPLRFVQWLPFPSMAAANGQFMLFDAEGYQRHQCHAAVRDQVTEDIRIVHLLKTKGEKAGTFLGNGLIYCRMYHDEESALNGFSKNLLAGFGYSVTGLSIFVGLVWLSVPWLLLAAPVGGLLAMSMIFGMQVLLARLSGQPADMLLRLHLPRLLAFSRIALRSIRRHLTGTNEWKGRKIR